MQLGGLLPHHVEMVVLLAFLPLLDVARGQVTKAFLLKEMQYLEKVEESVSMSSPVASDQ